MRLNLGRTEVHLVEPGQAFESHRLDMNTCLDFSPEVTRLFESYRVCFTVVLLLCTNRLSSLSSKSCHIFLEVVAQLAKNMDG